MPWIFAWLGSIVGLAALVFAAVLWVTTSRFLAHAIQARGQVVRLVHQHKGYFPVVTYRTAAGEDITFQAHSGSSPPSYVVGADVAVLYESDAPQDARLDSFRDLWFLPTLLSVLGFVFTGASSVGVVRLAKQRARWKSRLRLLKEGGQCLSTTLREVRIDRPLRAREAPRFRFVTEELESADGKRLSFVSERVVGDPSAVLHGQRISVLVDPDDSSCYLVDHSLLPRRFRRLGRG